MRYFPINLNLRAKKVLVVGAGAVGLRKAASLLACSPAELLLMDLRPLPDEERDKLNAVSNESADSLVFEQAEPNETHVIGRSLAFACTSSREINHKISELCRKHNILCNVADAPADGDFIVPAHFEHNGLSLAVSTSGQSPALARYLRQEIEGFVSRRFSRLLTLMARLRPMLLELGLESAQNAEIFRALVRSDLPDLLNKTELDEAALILHQYLPAPLHHRIGELLHDFH